MLIHVLWLSASLLLAITTSAHAQNQASSTALVESAPSVQNILNKMSQEAIRIQYRGVFTYQNQTSAALQSFKVEHWVDGGIQHDKVLFLNGPEREILREGQSVDCATMGNKLLQGGLTQIGGKLLKLGDLYQFEVRGQERIAGRIARVLQVTPRDSYRYGYFLSIDEEAGLVLKLWLVDENARPLERYQFVSLELNPSRVLLDSTPPSSHQHKALANITPCNPLEIGKPTGWQINWVPQGFVFAGQRSLPNKQEMLMYTDGLTTFSIFIESAAGLVPEGIGQRGATLAHMSRLMVGTAIYRVSVVGEIPIATAAKIAQNIAGQ